MEPRKIEAVRASLDQEVEAIKKIVKALAPLTVGEQTRVLNYIVDWTEVRKSVEG